MPHPKATPRAGFARQDRCVHCGRPEAQHFKYDGKLICEGSAGEAVKTFQTLNLPPGKTCADCVHTPRCVAIFGMIPEDQACDFFPIRFQQRNPESENR